MKRSAPVVAVLNMKGGVGKTTISAHLFRLMYSRFRLATVIVDLDPQFNLSQTLFTREQYEAHRAAGRSVLWTLEAPPSTGLFEVNASEKPAPRLDDVAVALRTFVKEPHDTLSVVPGDFGLVKYNLMEQSDRRLGLVRKRFQGFIDREKDRVGLICIDCNPSSSFLTMLALRACSHVLVPVRPDRYSILGLELLSKFLDSAPGLTPRPRTIALLNGIPRTGYDRRVEGELRSHPLFGPQTLANRVYESDILLARSDRTGFATDRKVPWINQLKDELSAVADELGQAIGLRK